jgi:hypothetical protein
MPKTGMQDYVHLKRCCCAWRACGQPAALLP